jgi:hypothetical protein
MVRMRVLVPTVVVLVGLAAGGCGGEGGGGGGGGTGAAATTTSTTVKGVERQKPAPGTGNVQGLVLYDDKPAAGIEVKVCTEFSQFLSGCGGDQHTATTGPDGVFVIADIPPVEYKALLVRVFDTDQYQFAQSGLVNAATYAVAADKTLFVETTHLYKSDLHVISPAAGSQVPPAALELRWDAYPSAAYYEVSVHADDVSVTSPVSGVRVDGTSYAVPKPLVPGLYRLKVEAFNAKDHKLTEAPEDLTFTVVG